MSCRTLSSGSKLKKIKCGEVPYERLVCKRSSEKYPLTTNEVHKVLRSYKVDDVDKVTIDNCSRGPLQGRVTTNLKTGERELTLFNPSNMALESRDMSQRESAISTLLHEIAHLRGVRDENLADKFSDKEFKNAKKILKNK